MLLFRQVLDSFRGGEVLSDVELAQVLGLRTSELKEVLQILERMGYLQRLRQGDVDTLTSCNSCPLKSACIPATGCTINTSTIFQLTEKGQRDAGQEIGTVRIRL